MKKKKLTALTISLQNKGHGTFPRHEKMANALHKNGFNIIWISPEGYKNKNFTKINLMMSFLPDLFFIGIYLKIFITCIFNFKNIKNIDVIFAIREYDAISIFFNPFFTKSKKIFFSRGDVPSILKINLPDRNFFQKNKDKFVIYFYPFLRRLINKKADLILLQANFLKKIYLKGSKYNLKKIKILPNDCIYKKIKKNNRIIRDEISIGFVAPMYWSCKGLGVIVKLYNELVRNEKNFKLHLAGDGPQAKKIKQHLSKISSKNYIWNGWVNNVHKFFEKIDILIIPSLYDSSPNLLFEALQNEKIIFATDISAHREILKDNELLFSKKNIKNLISKITRIKNSKIYKINLEKKILDAKKKSTFDWETKFSELVKKC